MINGKREMSDRALPIVVRVERILVTAGHADRVRPRTESPERGRVRHLHRYPYPLHQHIHVLPMGEIIRIDVGIDQRVPALQPYPTGTLRPEEERKYRPCLGPAQRLVHRVVHAVPKRENLSDLFRVRIDRAWKKMELDVGIIVIRVSRVDERDALHPGVGHRSPLVQNVLHYHGQGLETVPLQADRFVHDKRESTEAHVILKIIADPEIRYHGDAELGQVLLGPYTGQHQQLGSVDRPRRQNDLASDAYHLVAAVSQNLDADGPPPLVEDHSQHVRFHRYVKVLPVLHRPEERLGRGATIGPPDRCLGQHEPGLIRAVHVAILVAELLTGLEERDR